jgi:hypothetical protein
MAKCTREEEARLGVPGVFLEKTVHSLRENILGMFAHAIFSLVEIATSDREDGKSMNVIVPSSMRHRSILQSIAEDSTQVSVVPCISTAEESITPYMCPALFPPLPART